MADSEPREKRLPALDGLRALAVVLVFAHHIDQKALPGGFVGVDVFFVLSGYLITFLLLSEHRRYGTVNLKNFYVRRALRLYPALLTLVFVVGIVSATDHIGRPVPDSVFAAFYLTDFWENVQPDLSLLSHTWSLSVEEQFYLLWPAILVYTLHRKWSVSRVVWGLILVNVLITFGIFEAHYGRLRDIQYLPFAHVAELGAGVLLAIQAQSGLSTFTRRVAHPAVGLLALATIITAEVFLKAHWWAFPLDTLMCWPIVASLVVNRDSTLSRVFGSRPMVWLGERSYGFYLWHYPIVIFMVIHGVPIVTRILAGGALTVIIMVASWELIEKPFLRRKVHFERVPDSVVADPQAPIVGPLP